MLNTISEKEAVSLDQFTSELEKEYSYQMNGGTAYRAKTAQLAVHVSRLLQDLNLVSDRKATKQFVQQVYQNINSERADDVAKMLHVIAKDLHLNTILSDGCKEYVKKRRLERKPLSFK